MGNGALAIGPKLPRPSWTLPLTGHWFKSRQKSAGLNGPRTCLRVSAFRKNLLVVFPDAHFASLGHQEQREHEAHRGNCDRVDKRIAETTRRRVSRRGDEWHQPATPAVSDHIRHGYRRVADPAGEKFGEERADRPVDHPD